MSFSGEYSFLLLEHKQRVLWWEVNCCIVLHLWKRHCCCCWVTSFVSDSVRSHRRQPPQAPPSLGFSRKNTGVGCHFLFHWKRQKLWSFLLQSCHWSCSVGWLWSVLHIAAALVSFLSTNRYPNVRAEGSYLRSTSLILWSTFSSELFSNFKCISGALKLNTQACFSLTYLEMAYQRSFLNQRNIP